MFVDHFKFVQSVKTLNMTVTVKNDKENSTKRELASLYFLFAILSAELIDDNNESGLDWRQCGNSLELC